MPFAAVISASATLDHGDGPLRATLVFAGQTLVEYQARQAAQAGAGHISIHVNAITPPLSRSVDRLNADGISVSLVRTPAELRQTIPPDTDILLIGDGVIAAQSLYAEMARHSAPVLLTVNERIKEPGFERIDAQYRWAGLARLNFRQLMDTVHTLDLLADWDLQSTLLRHAVQAGAGRLPVEDEALFGGAIVLIDTQAAADAAEKKFLPAQSTSAEGQGWVEHYTFRPIAERTAPWLLRQQIQPRHLRMGAMVTAAIALIIASYGLTWPAIALFLAALATENIGNILAHVTRRPERFSWRAYICPALALLGLAVLGSHWRVNPIADQFAGLHLCASILIVELAIRRGRAGKLKSWAVCSLGVALLLLLLFRLMGLLDLGFALVTLYALGTIGLMLLRRPEVRSRSAPSKETA